MDPNHEVCLEPLYVQLGIVCASVCVSDKLEDRTLILFFDVIMLGRHKEPPDVPWAPGLTTSTL